MPIAPTNSAKTILGGHHAAYLEVRQRRDTEAAEQSRWADGARAGAAREHDEALQALQRQVQQGGLAVELDVTALRSVLRRYLSLRLVWQVVL